VDIFGRKILAWDSLGLEAHKLDTMARTLDDDDSLWRPERFLEVPHPFPYYPNVFPLEAKTSHFKGLMLCMG
jgi:hypothetical protein